MKSYFQQKCEVSRGGQIKEKFENWKKLTDDIEILETVKGATFEFKSVPQQTFTRPSQEFSAQEEKFVKAEIDKLKRKRVVVTSQHEDGEYISPIFMRKKKDGSFRLILNFKDLNSHIVYQHFKMGTINTILKLVKKGCFMCSVDIKDAYHSVPIQEDYQKFLKFYWKKELLKFVCFPNGLGRYPRKFTKLLKPILAELRMLSYIILGYIDYVFNQGDTYNECVHYVIDTIVLFDSLNFVIQPEKTSFMPKQVIKILGFVILFG